MMNITKNEINAIIARAFTTAKIEANNKMSERVITLVKAENAEAQKMDRNDFFEQAIESVEKVRNDLSMLSCRKLLAEDLEKAKRLAQLARFYEYVAFELNIGKRDRSLITR